MVVADATTSEEKLDVLLDLVENTKPELLNQIYISQGDCG